MGTLIAAVLNGTGSISDLDAIAKQFGVAIDVNAIPEMKDLASVTRTLAAEFRKLEAWLRKQTGSTGVVSAASSSITQADAFSTVMANAFRSALTGQPHIGGLASGGWVKARRGGTVMRLGEGGQDELVTPASQVVASGNRGVRDIVDALGPLSTLESMYRAVVEMLDELRKQTDMARTPAPAPATGPNANMAAMAARR